MSKYSEKVKIYSIDLEKIEPYINIFPQSHIKKTADDRYDLTLDEEGHNYAELVSVRNNIRDPALKSFYDRIYPDTAHPLSQQERLTYYQVLLSSLEIVSKLPSLISCVRGAKITTEFRIEFLSQLNAPTSELTNFLNEVKNLTFEDHQIGSITACAILDLIQNIELRDIFNNMTNNLNIYKGGLLSQSLVDINRMGINTYCEEKSKKFKDIADFKAWGIGKGLTGEQIDLAIHWCNQGGIAGFSSIILTYSHCKKSEVGPLRVQNNFQEAAVLVEIEDNNKVSLTHQLRYNNSDANGKTEDSIAVEIFKLDITQLKNKEFIPGLASKKLIYEVVILSLNPDFTLNVPEAFQGPKIDLDQFLKNYIVTKFKGSSTDEEICDSQRTSAPILNEVINDLRSPKMEMVNEIEMWHLGENIDGNDWVSLEFATNEKFSI